MTAEEVQLGLVVHLDSDQLRSLGRTRTNAEIVHGEDRAVTGNHYFIIVARDEKSDQCLAVPLSSSRGKGDREKLDDELKAGPREKWVGDSYLLPYQHWWIPIADIVATSGDDEGTLGNRRSYATFAREELERIAALQERNRVKEFRLL